MSVESAWDVIVRWLQANAPRTLAAVNPPAPLGALAAVEAVMEQPMPDDLRAWWRCANGLSWLNRKDSLWPPSFHPLPVHEAISTRQSWLSVHGEEGDEGENGVEAGTESWSWLPQYLPIATDACGVTLFVDLRPGPLRGCVMEWDKVGACDGVVLWPAVGLMLAEIATALEGNGTAAGCRAVCSGSRLDWHPLDMG